MNENEPLTGSPAPDAAEVPFVPYASEFQEGKTKAKKMLRLLIITFCAAALTALVLAGLRHYNFYHKSMNTITFDYREGEIVDPDSDVQPGVCSTELAASLSDQLHFTAHQTMFNTDGYFIPAISDYEYSVSGKEQYLTVRTGAEDSIFTGTTEQRFTAEGYALKKGSKWEKSIDYAFPNYKQLFFGVESGERYTFSCYESYDTIVSSKAYICEVWLAADHSSSRTIYYTLYRYYTPGGRLAAVRMLSDQDEIMEVYEITDYTV